MSKGIKVKLNQLYSVIADEPNFLEYTRPAIEVFSASSNVTIRATTNPDFRGAVDELPLVADDAAEGEVFVTEAGRSVSYIGFSCSDADAEIYVSGFDLREAPTYEIDSFEIVTRGTGFKAGDMFEHKEESDIEAAVFKVLSVKDGMLESVAVSVQGRTTTDFEEPVEVPGGKVNGYVELTTSSYVRYHVTSADIVAGGTGYEPGDFLDIAGADGDILASLNVVDVDENGSITMANLDSDGEYVADVSGEGVSLVGGSGTGATADVVAEDTTYYIVADAEITEPGEGYAAETIALPIRGGTILTFSTMSGVVQDIKLVNEGKLLSDVSSIEPEGLGVGLELSVETKKIY